MASADLSEDSTCLKCSFKIGKAVSDVTLTQVKLSWVKKGDAVEKSVHVPVDEILSVKKLNGRKGEGFEVIGFAVCYIKHQKKYLLKQETVQFLGSSEVSEQWSTKIQDALDQAPRRPRKLLVIVNPISGSGNGMKIYHNTAAGIFKLANIETDVRVTERAHHCEELLGDYDITSIDGIVLVGGDGIYHEAVTGLQRRILKEAGLDENDPATDLPCVPVPIGIIPAGTGNGIAVGCYGCPDAQTATLAIIAGKRLHSNVLSVHCEQDLVGYASLLIGYGIWGDLIHHAETRRGLKKLRYLSGMIAMIVKSRRRMDLDINYLPPLTTEEHENESNPISETKTAKESSSAMPDSESCTKDKEVTDLVVDKSSKELQIKESEETDEAAKHPEPKGEGTEPKPEGKELMDEGKESKDEGQEPTDDRKEPEGSDIKSPIKTLSENPVESKALVEEDKAAKSEKGALKEQQSNQGDATQWKSTQGNYIGVMLFIADYWSHYEKTSTSGNYTRMILNKPCGGLRLVSALIKMLMQKPDALENNFTDHMPLKEMTIKLPHPSDPTSVNGIKEHIIDIDGEIYPLKQPQFTIRFHPKVIQLFAAPTDLWLWKNNKIE